MEKRKKERVEWFLNFANADINAPPETKVKLFRNMQTVFESTLHPELKGFFASMSDDETAALIIDKDETLSRLKNMLVTHLEELSNRLSNTKEYGGKAKQYKNNVGSSEILSMRSLGSIGFNAHAEIRISGSPKVERNPENRQWRAYWNDGVLEKARMSLVINVEESDEGFFFSFMQSLNGLYLNALGRCAAPSCGKWFLQAGRRKRVFCSESCRVNKFNREKRRKIKEHAGKAYAEELQKSNKRARSSYENKIKKKLGPKVQAQRIPRKHKEGE
jgi:hypothetical protein